MLAWPWLAAGDVCLPTRAALLPPPARPLSCAGLFCEGVVEY